MKLRVTSKGYATCGLLAILCVALAACAGAEELDARRVLQIKAAFTYKFLKYITWSSDLADRPRTPLTICLVGGDPFGGMLQRLVALDDPDQAATAVRIVAEGETLRNCHLAYLNPASKISTQAFVARLHELNIASVGDRVNFVEEGGMIQLFTDGKNMFFRINLAAALKEKIEISSRLLALAKSLITP